MALIMHKKVSHIMLPWIVLFCTLVIMLFGATIVRFCSSNAHLIHVDILLVFRRIFFHSSYFFLILLCSFISKTMLLNNLITCKMRDRWSIACKINNINMTSWVSIKKILYLNFIHKLDHNYKHQIKKSKQFICN